VGSDGDESEDSMNWDALTASIRPPAHHDHSVVSNLWWADNSTERLVSELSPLYPLPITLSSGFKQVHRKKPGNCLNFLTEQAAVTKQVPKPSMLV
jgi:hypothetical protein